MITLKVVKMMTYVIDRVENIVRKGENAGYQHFLLIPQCFQKPSCPRWLKVGIGWERVNKIYFITKLQSYGMIKIETVLQTTKL